MGARWHPSSRALAGAGIDMPDGHLHDRRMRGMKSFLAVETK
jgi:hypothetical protein